MNEQKYNTTPETKQEKHQLNGLLNLDKVDPVLERQAAAIHDEDWVAEEIQAWEAHHGMAFRPYQAEAIDLIHRMLDANQRGVYQLPTGGGKTHIGIGIALYWLQRSDSHRVVWLTHRKELELQSYQRLVEAGISDDQLLVISPIKLRNMVRKGNYVPTSYDLLVVDECHHGVATTWIDTIKQWPGKVLGLTATPWRLSKKQGLNEAFEALVPGPQAQELVQKWYLAPMDVYAPIEDMMIHGAGTSAGGDYNAKQTLQGMEGENRTVLVEMGIEWLERHWERIGRECRTIIYCIGVQHAHAVARFAEECGHKSAVLLGETPKEERDGMLARFAAGEFNILANAEVATEGFDIPSVEIVLILRPTKSLALYLQMAGRATRPQKEKRAIILDAAGNCRRLGLPYDPRQWSLSPRGEHAQGMMPTRACPECKCENSIAARHCYACGYAFGEACPKCGNWETKGLIQAADGVARCTRCHEDVQQSLFYLGEEEVTSTKTFYDQATPLEKLPLASPSRLRDGTWGFWVNGKQAMSMIKPGMYVRIRTRAGKEWKKRIKEVIWTSKNPDRPGILCSEHK